jgi:hypothetical protein
MDFLHRQREWPRRSHLPAILEGLERGYVLLMATGRVTCPRGAEPISYAFSEDIVDPDPAFIFRWACDLGLEGIVSKRKDSRYVTGRSPYWVKSKNPESEAVRREAEEEWGR